MDKDFALVGVEKIDIMKEPNPNPKSKSKKISQLGFLSRVIPNADLVNASESGSKFWVRVRSFEDEKIYGWVEKRDLIYKNSFIKSKLKPNQSFLVRIGDLDINLEPAGENIKIGIKETYSENGKTKPKKALLGNLYVYKDIFWVDCMKYPNTFPIFYYTNKKEEYMLELFYSMGMIKRSGK